MVVVVVVVVLPVICLQRPKAGQGRKGRKWMNRYVNLEAGRSCVGRGTSQISLIGQLGMMW
jgi:hypothetical protein